MKDMFFRIWGDLHPDMKGLLAFLTCVVLLGLPVGTVIAIGFGIQVAQQQRTIEIQNEARRLDLEERRIQLEERAAREPQ